MSHGKFRASFEVSIKFKHVFFLNPYRRCSHRHSCLYHCISGNNWASQDCTPDSRWVSEGRGKESNRVLGLMTDHESLGLWTEVSTIWGTTYSSACVNYTQPLWALVSSPVTWVALTWRWPHQADKEHAERMPSTFSVLSGSAWAKSAISFPKFLNIIQHRGFNDTVFTDLKMFILSGYKLRLWKMMPCSERCRWKHYEGPITYLPTPGCFLFAIWHCFSLLSDALNWW